MDLLDAVRIGHKMDAVGPEAFARASIEAAERHAGEPASSEHLREWASDMRGFWRRVADELEKMAHERRGERPR